MAKCKYDKKIKCGYPKCGSFCATFRNSGQQLLGQPVYKVPKKLVKKRPKRNTVILSNKNHNSKREEDLSEVSILAKNNERS